MQKRTLPIKSGYINFNYVYSYVPGHLSTASVLFFLCSRLCEEECHTTGKSVCGLNVALRPIIVVVHLLQTNYKTITNSTSTR